MRFDLAVELFLPKAGKLRLAHQIRQDAWRVLRHLRAFAPIVRIEDAQDGLRVLVGGKVEGAFAKASSEAQLRDALSHPDVQRRWLRCAR